MSSAGVWRDGVTRSARFNRRDSAAGGFGAAAVWPANSRRPCDSIARVTLELLPAVDVADGQAVRLVQGELGSETSYGSPLDAALQWQTDGAEWIHLVDLDAAFGKGSNRELLADVVGRLDVKVELSGGIRDDASLEAALATGCTRVNLGTAALEDPDWCAGRQPVRRPDRGRPRRPRRRTLAARGWTKEGGDLFEMLERLDADGCARYVVTDVTKDGTSGGSQPRAAAPGVRADRQARRRVRRRLEPARTCATSRP